MFAVAGSSEMSSFEYPGRFGQPVLVWFDLETTGLEDDAEIVEVAAVVTDSQLVEGMSFHSVRVPSKAGKRQIMETPDVLEMHKASGLWSEIAGDSEGPDVGVLDHSLTQMLIASREKFGSDCVFYLAGSGVAGFDRRFIKRDFPRMDAMLHYSSVDMSIVRRTLQIVGGKKLPEAINSSPHRAMSDVRAAIASARILTGSVALVGLG